MTGRAAARLDLGSLAHVPRLSTLARGDVRPGVVHLGLGAFARAHTAVVTERAMARSGDPSWGLVGSSQRSRQVVDQLAPQDGLFSVLERGAGAAAPAVVSSVLAVLDGTAQAEEVSEAVAAAETGVVTLTVTEKGYTSTAQRTLDRSNPAVAADLLGRPPVTTIGRLCAALARRRAQDGGPITVVSCDNLPENGDLTRRLVTEFAAATDHALLRWVEESVRFPSTMVDRIVPATTGADLADAARALGVEDHGATVAEPFLQWVVQDDFAGARPPWDAGGAVLTDDVAPWEAVKLRLLNASHTLLALLGRLGGAATIAESLEQPGSRRAARSLMDEAISVLDVPDGLDVHAYRDSVLVRFANPALRHTTAKVAADTSQKLGPRVLPTVRALRAGGAPARWSALALAAWVRLLVTDPPGTDGDPLAARLAEALATAGDPVRAVLSVQEVFGADLADDGDLVRGVRTWYRDLERFGTSALRAEPDHD